MAANFFDQFDPATAKPEGGGKDGNFFDQFDPGTAKPEPKRSLGGIARDIGVTALKGAVGLPQAAVGLLDIPTGGHAGKALEGAGLRFKDAQDTLDTMYSPAQQAANRKVQEAEGFMGTAKAMLENPSTIATGIGESLPQMLGGAGVARGLMAAAPRLGAVAAGAIGEGVVGAGSAAEQVRQQTADGLLTGKQAALVGASGLATAGLGALGGKVAQRMGVGDVDTMLAGGTARAAGQGSTRSTARQVLEGAVAEGALEEMPQSMAEQALQNVALERPWDQGVGAAAAQGLITGAAMGGVGGGVGASANRAHQRAEAQALQADPTRAWNTEAGAADPNRPATERAAPPEAPELQTSPGAAGPREGMDFAREVDTAGLALEDPAEVARARAATMDFQPTDATPQWDTARGAVQDGQPGLDMPAPEFDTGSLGLESRSRSLTPSQQMGIDPEAGPLSKVAAAAVDAGTTQEAQFLGATGRDLQVRRTGPGVADESNVIDVQGRVVEDRAIGTPRRIEARQRLGATESAPLSAAVSQPQSIPNAPANGGSANATPALSMQALAAMNNVANQSPNLPNGVPNGRQATQAQQTAQEPAQAGAAPRAASERAPLEGSPGAAGQVGKVSPGVDAFEPAASRQEGWRKSMLKAGPAAKAMGIDPRGKRLAQVVAEIDAADAQRAGVRQDGADLAAGQIDREWSAFAPETGTLGVPRAEMPQIKAEHRGALVNFLKARGIDSRADEVPANDLKPTQAEFSPAKVKKARAFQGGDRSILVSSDGYVLDGHHQWLAKRANGEPVKVIRLQAPIREVLAQTAEFPSTASARGAQLKQGGTDAATSRDLRLADERAPGAAAPASDRAGPTAGSAAPAVGAGQREGGDTAQPAPAVRAAVPDAGGSGQRAADVAPAAPSQSANSRSASEKQRDDYRAAEAKRTAPGARARSAAADANPFKAFIAKHGIALDQRREFAPGTTEQRQAMVPGYGPIFRRTGKPLDLLAQSAVDEGFLVSPDAAALHDLIGRALRGERIVAQYTADAAEIEMQSRVARQREMEEDAATAVAALSDPSLFDLNDDDIVLTADSNTSTEEAMRSLGFTEQEIQDVIAQESAGTPEGSARSGGADETDARPAQGSAGQGTQEAQPQRVARQDLLGDAPNESQQAAARERARRQQQDGAQRNAAPGPEDFTLGMVDANTGREVAPGQGSIFGAQQDAASTTSQGDGQQVRAARPGSHQESVKNQVPALDQKAQVATKSGANSAAAGPRPARAAAPRSTTRIDDFGETLHGARKMLYAEAYADGMAKAKELDTKAHPLSKTWPEPDYQKLLEGGAPVDAVSLARALREAVPTKPQSAWKLKGWATKVEALRGFAEDVLSGRLDTKTVEGSMERSGLRGVPNKAALYEAMGHEQSLKGLELSAAQYSMYDSVRYDPARTIWTVAREAKGSAFGNWPRELAKGDTREAAIAAFKKRSAELLAEEQAPTKGATFEIYSKRAGGAREFFIGKKIGRNVAELKAGFADLKAARQYKADHQSELEDLLAKYKAVPTVRNTQNAPRIGEDYRKGADVTPERFQDAFGFRGVQFGNYVEGGRRQQDLNRAYDAMMDLAGVLGLPPRALSLGGRLGLAFGARGTGGTDAAAAHYERGNVVINLTKREGAGSLAHEWWHALDNYFSRQRGYGDSYMTEDARSGDGVREEMRAAFRAVVSAINLTGMQERSRKLDDRRTTAYWTTKPEMSARAFESYVIAKLQDQNAGNDYLANVVGDAMFALEGAYPYPTAGELPQIRSAFDAFFQTVETRQGDAGETVLFSREADQPMSQELARALLAIRRPATKESVRAAVHELVNGMGTLPNRLGRVVVATAAEIQQDWEPLIGPIQLNSEEQGQQGGAGKAQGFYDPNSRTVFVIADHIRQGDELGVVAHELMHKHGQAVLGEEGWNRLHGAIEGWAGAPEGSQERQVYDEAAARVRNSRPNNAAEQEYSSQELFPYAVQVALEQGVRPNLLAKQGTVARWLGQVKAALREVWSKIVGKPESFNSQDLVNLAFGIAQRENPAHSVELDGAVANAPEDRVGSTLLELGRDERLYQYPRSDSTDLVQIGAAKDLSVGPVDRNARESEVWMLANTTPADGDGVKSWMVRLPNGRPATITDNKGQVYINVSAVGEGGGGSRVYDLAANYALNNGAVFVGDPNGVSASAMRRRLENMLSSAIKYGTTDHLAPHPDQVTGRDGVAPLEWTPGDTLGNIESMVKASVAATEATNPLATSYVRYEPQTRSFDIDPDYGGRSGQVAQDLSDLLDFDGRKVGLGQGGRRTVQRTVFLRALLSGVGERRRVLERFRNEPTRGSQGSAAPEEGTTDRRIFYSRSVAAAPATGDYTPAQQRAAKHAFGVQKQQTLAERAQAFRANLGTKLRQGLVDQFAPLKEVSDKAYMLARMSKGSDGAVEAALLYGKVFLRDGVYDVDVKDGGFAQVLASLKGEHDRFFQWVAAQRAERLKAEGKENLLTDQDITALGTLNAGKMADGAARMPVYAAALRELNVFNESALKVAMESGLIDQAAFNLMKDQPYVPFYRLMEEDGGMRGPRFSSGLVNQQAWKKLKGGTQQLNADLLQNTLLNWSHLYGAAARNRASLETMAAADKMGIAYQVSADTKGAVKVMRDGVAEHWAVEDPYLLDAISAMSYAPGGIVKAMAPFKRLLTFGVTVNPTFKIRNLIRDSLSAIAQSDLSYNPLENVAKGWTATSKKSQTYASMLASGGIIKFGTQEDSGRVRTLIEKLGGQVLDQDGWGKLKSQMRSLWETYEEFGDRTENVNRAALYERLVAKGHSHAEASFMARDLMDFSMSGKWEVVRFLTQTVPFLNARMQGLYKLGRAAKEDPRRFAAMAGAVSLASLGLMAAYGDDDDWKKREDWDRDNYWWFKIGSTAFRIPKPFEVGAIGTLAERTAELMMSEEMTGKRFGQRISDMVFNTFAMDPTPQFIKPFIDVYANKDSFSGRPIEGMADERLRPQDRYSERTSEVARLLGSWGLPDPLRLAKGEYSSLSPKQIDFLLRGYFGWLATVATTVTDAAARPAMDRGERPGMRLRDTFLAGNFVESLPTGSSRYVTTMYEQAKEVEQAWASYQTAVKSGDMEKAREIQQDEAPKLRNRMAVENAKRQIAELGQQAKRIESNRLMPAEEKRRRLDEIEARKHEAARRVAPTS